MWTVLIYRLQHTARQAPNRIQDPNMTGSTSDSGERTPTQHTMLNAGGHHIPHPDGLGVDLVDTIGEIVSSPSELPNQVE